MKTMVTDEVRTVKAVEDLTICSSCGVRLDQNFDLVKYANVTKKKDVNYFHVTKYHHDWGEESCDSFEHGDYCLECFKKLWQPQSPDEGVTSPELMRYLISEHPSTGDVEIESNIGAIDADYDFEKEKRLKEEKQRAEAERRNAIWNEAWVGMRNKIMESAGISEETIFDSALQEEDERDARVATMIEEKRSSTLEDDNER